MCPSRIPKGKSRGWIIPVGGAEVKENNPSILSRFVKLCGGSKARIAIIPTASRLLETGPKYERIFKALGAKSAVSVDFETRKQGADPTRLAVFDGVTGVFFGPDFVTVTKTESVDWPHIKPQILGAIMEHFQSGQPVIEGEGTNGGGHAEHTGEDGDVVRQIKELLDTRVTAAQELRVHVRVDDLLPDRRVPSPPEERDLEREAEQLAEPKLERLLRKPIDNRAPDAAA